MYSASYMEIVSIVLFILVICGAHILLFVSCQFFVRPDMRGEGLTFILARFSSPPCIFILTFNFASEL